MRARLALQQQQLQQQLLQHVLLEVKCAQVGELHVARARARPLGLPLTVLANLDNFIEQEITSEDFRIGFYVFPVLSHFVFAWSFLFSFVQLLFSIA